MNMFNFMRQVILTEDGLVLFTLCTNIILMFSDFIIGSLGAVISKDTKFNSRTGSLGLLRKFAVFLVLVILIPVSVLIPEPFGIGALYMFYFGFMTMELTSIVENLKKLEYNTEFLERFIAVFIKNQRKEE